MARPNVASRPSPSVSYALSTSEENRYRRGKAMASAFADDQLIINDLRSAGKGAFDE